MATLSSAEIRRYASNAGFTGGDLDIAVAVAMAESGGNPQAHNTKAPDNSYGLWQINMYGDLGPGRRKTFGIASNDSLFNPDVNARAAYTIFKGSGWKAWTTYTRGTYKQFMSGDTSGSGGGGGIGSTIADATGLSAVANSINSVGKNLFNGVASTLGIIAAMFFIAVGIAIFLRAPLRKLVKR